MSVWLITIYVLFGIAGGIIGGLICAAIILALTPWWAKGGWRR